MVVATIPFFPRFIIPPWIRLTKKAADDIKALLFAQILFYLEILVVILYEFRYDKDLQNVATLIEYSFTGGFIVDTLIKIVWGLVVVYLLFTANYILSKTILTWID